MKHEDGKIDLYSAVPSSAPSPAQLAEYVGIYSRPEIDPVYELMGGSGKARSITSIAASRRMSTGCPWASGRLFLYTRVGQRLISDTGQRQCLTIDKQSVFDRRMDDHWSIQHDFVQQFVGYRYLFFGICERRSAIPGFADRNQGLSYPAAFPETLFLPDIHGIDPVPIAERAHTRTCKGLQNCHFCVMLASFSGF